jgi:surface carbohydrate biosynthesis protein
MTNQLDQSIRNARKVLILVPNKLRDLEGHALVAYHLKYRHGYQVRFCSDQQIQDKLLEEAPDALVLDYLGIDSRVTQAALAKSLGVKVFVLPTAGFFLDSEGEARRAGKWLNRSVSQFVDCYFTWGHYAREVLLEYGLMSEPQLMTVGCPRFDLYAEAFQALIGSRAELMDHLGIANSQAPLIIWPTNCYFVRLNNPKLMAHGKRPGAEIRAELEDDETQNREMSQLLLALARQHRDWNFIIKVHPSEFEKPYLGLTAQRPNLRIACGVGIRELLYHSDVLLQRWSTTATEAWMLGKPVIEYSAGHYNLKEPQEYLNCNDVVTSIDHADQTIERYLMGQQISPEQQRARDAFISKLYYRIDGKAAERCAEVINKALSPPIYTDENHDETQTAVHCEYLNWKRWQNRRLANRVKDAVHIDRQVSLRFWRRGFGTAPNSCLEITQEEVDRLHHRFSQVLS